MQVCGYENGVAVVTFETRKRKTASYYTRRESFHLTLKQR
jgi:hypothetical protein